MRSSRRTAGAAAVGLGALFVLTGCSLDAVIWGPDGAAVIDQTERLIDAV